MAVDPQVLLGRNFSTATGTSRTWGSSDAPGNASSFPDGGNTLEVGDDLWFYVASAYTPAQTVFGFPSGWTMTDRVTASFGRFELWHYGRSTVDSSSFSVSVTSSGGSRVIDWRGRPIAFRNTLIDGPDTDLYPGVSSGDLTPTEGVEIARTAILLAINFGRDGSGGNVATANGWTNLGGSTGPGGFCGDLFLAKETSDGTTLPTFVRSARDSPSVNYGWAIFAADARRGRRGLGLIRG